VNAFVDSSVRLGVPFIAPRQLGAVEDNLGRLILSSVVWCTGQSGASPDSHFSCPVRDCFPKQAQSTVAASGPLAHRTVRCPLPTVGAGHASPAGCAVDRCAGDCWLTGQSGAPPDSPVNYSRTPLNFSRERPFHRRPAWRTKHCPMHHQTLSGAPTDSPVCQTELSFGCTEPSLFPILFSLFLALRQNLLVLKTMY
jgi:hypothetical protein